MAPSYAVRPAKKLPKPGSKFAALTPKSTGCSMEDLSGARAQSCRRSWILRKPADTTSQHSTTMAATAESASAYNWDGRPNRGRSHFFSSLVRRKWIGQELISSCSPDRNPLKIFRYSAQEVLLCSPE